MSAKQTCKFIGGPYDGALSLVLVSQLRESAQLELEHPKSWLLALGDDDLRPVRKHLVHYRMGDWGIFEFVRYEARA